MTPNPLNLSVDIGGIWHISLFASTVFCAFTVAREYLRRLPISAMLLWVYAVVSALFLIEYPRAHFGDYNAAFKGTAGETLAELLLIPLAVITFKRENFIKVLRFVVGFQIACVWMKMDGLMIAPSFNTAFIALCLPFLGPFQYVFGLVTIFTHHGSTAMMIVGAQALAFAINFKALRPVFAFLCICILGFAYFHSNGPLLDGSERIQQWTKYMSFWATETRWIIFGTGPGSFMFLGMELMEYQPPHFLQMHSDFLQVAFELGVTGFLLCLGVAVRAIRNTWSDAPMLATVLGACAFTLTYHPLRFAPSAMVMAFIFYSASVFRRSNSEFR